MINKLILLIVLWFLSSAVIAQNNSVTMNLNQVNIAQVLQLLAKKLQQNIMLSPAIAGSISLKITNADVVDVMQLILTSQGLATLPIGKTWYIAPVAEITQAQQDQIKLHEMRSNAEKLARLTWQIRFAKAEEISAIVKDNGHSLLSQRGSIQVDKRTNTLSVQDEKENLADICSLIKKLDIPVRQILIEGRLASIDNDYERRLGLKFLSQNNQETSTQSSTSESFGLAIAKLAHGATLDVLLTALEKEGHGELISSPSLFTANQQAASIEAGEEIPYQEVSRSGATSVAFKKAVLSLKVVPQILPGNKVLLQLQVNQDKPSDSLVLGVPTITTRQIITNVLVKNGQTIVLGGIYETNEEKGEERIPFLGKIPLLGNLFRQQHRLQNKRELLIFVTPKIIDAN